MKGEMEAREKEVPRPKASTLKEISGAGGKQEASHHPPGNTAALLACRESIFLHWICFSFKTVYS